MEKCDECGHNTLSYTGCSICGSKGNCKIEEEDDIEDILLLPSVCQLQSVNASGHCLEDDIA